MREKGAINFNVNHVENITHTHTHTHARILCCVVMLYSGKSQDCITVSHIFRFLLACFLSMRSRTDSGVISSLMYEPQERRWIFGNYVRAVVFRYFNCASSWEESQNISDYSLTGVSPSHQPKTQPRFPESHVICVINRQLN